MLGRRIRDDVGAESGKSTVGLGYFDTETFFEGEKQRTRVEGAFGNVKGVLYHMSDMPVKGYEIHMGKTVSKHPLVNITSIKNSTNNTYKFEQKYLYSDGDIHRENTAYREKDSLQTKCMQWTDMYIERDLHVENDTLGKDIVYTKEDVCQSDSIQRTSSEYIVDGMQNGNVYGTYIHGIFDQAQTAKALIQALAEAKGLQDFRTDVNDYESYRESQFDILADELRNSLNMKEIYRILFDHV